MAEISVFRGSDSRPFLSSQIDLKGYASSDRNIAADLEGDTLYIAWVSGNPDKNIPSAVNLRILNLTGKQTLFDRVVYEQPWGIERLVMARHPGANNLLVAYNDFGKRNAENLYLASFPLDDLQRKALSLSPRPIHLRDKWEKGFPHFWKSQNRLFLYHSTGDTWGLLAYRGRSAVAVSEIDAQGEPRNYSVIAEESAVNNEIRIWDNTVYYEHVTGENRGEYELRKIDLNQTHKPFH